MNISNLLTAIQSGPDKTITGEIFYSDDGWAVRADGSAIMPPACLSEIADVWKTMVLDTLPPSSRSALTTGGVNVKFVLERKFLDITFRPEVDTLNSHLYVVRLAPEIRLIK